MRQDKPKADPAIIERIDRGHRWIPVSGKLEAGKPRSYAMTASAAAAILGIMLAKNVRLSELRTAGAANLATALLSRVEWQPHDLTRSWMQKGKLKSVPSDVPGVRLTFIPKPRKERAS